MTFIMVNLAEMSHIIRRTCKIQQKIQIAEARATRTTTFISGMPHSKAKCSIVEDGAVTISDLKEVYSVALDGLQAMRSELAEMVDTLQNMDDRTVMTLMYVKGYKPRKIADSLFMTERNVFYHLKHAKAELTEKFPGRFSIE